MTGIHSLLINSAGTGELEGYTRKQLSTIGLALRAQGGQVLGDGSEPGVSHGEGIGLVARCSQPFGSFPVALV